MRLSINGGRVHRWLPWAVVGAVMVGGWALWGQDSESKAAPAPQAGGPKVPVRVVDVRQEDLVVELRAVGQVQAAAQAVVRPRVEGLLNEVRFSEGQNVRAGDILARLDDREAKATVLRLQADVARLKAQVALAETDLKRYEDLAAQSAISTQQLDGQRATVHQLQAQLEAAQAAVVGAQVQLDHTVIRSPISGRIGLRAVDVGNIVRPQDAAGLVTVAQVHPIQVVFALPQQQWPQLREALQRTGRPAVRLLEAGGVAVQEVDAATTAGESGRTGRLLTPDNQIDVSTGTLRLKAEFPNADLALLPGQSATVRFPARTLEQVLTVPAVAVRQGLQGPMVWRVNAEGQAEAVRVQPLWQDDRRVAIQTGLAAGERIVVDGQSRLKPGAAVRVLDEAASEVAQVAATAATQP